MSPKERRAYRFGYLRAMRRARRDLDAMARRLDDDIAELMDDVQDMKNEYYRLKAIEEGIDTERDAGPQCAGSGRIAFFTSDPFRLWWSGFGCHSHQEW